MIEVMSPRYNYYEVLEISPFCAQHEITTAYERAKLTYSGENQAIYTMFSEDEARELLRLVEEAYAVLGNKTLRALYDEKLGHSQSKKIDATFETLKLESRTVFNPSPKKTSTLKAEYKVDVEFENTIKETTEWDGSLLKKVREYKAIPLERMSEITRITAFYINAIEEMATRNLPAQVFVRGYVAQIAKVLGLNERRVCDSYMKSFKNQVAKK